MAVGIDVLAREGVAQERVVIRDRAVGVDAQDLAADGAEVLGIGARGRQEQRAVLSEGQPRHASGALRRAPDIGEVLDPLAVPMPASHGHVTPRAVGLVVGDVDQAVAGEIGMQHDVHVTVRGAGIAGFAREDRIRPAGDEPGAFRPGLEQMQLTLARHDQHVAIGQEGQRHRVFDIARDHLDANVHSFGGAIMERALWQRVVGNPGRRDRISAGRHLDPVLRRGPGAENACRQHNTCCADSRLQARSKISHVTPSHPLVRTDISQALAKAEYDRPWR